MFKETIRKDYSEAAILCFNSLCLRSQEMIYFYWMKAKKAHEKLEGCVDVSDTLKFAAVSTTGNTTCLTEKSQAFLLDPMRLLYGIEAMGLHGVSLADAPQMMTMKDKFLADMAGNAINGPAFASFLCSTISAIGAVAGELRTSPGVEVSADPGVLESPIRVEDSCPQEDDSLQVEDRHPQIDMDDSLQVEDTVSQIDMVDLLGPAFEFSEGEDEAVDEEGEAGDEDGEGNDEEGEAGDEDGEGSEEKQSPELGEQVDYRMLRSLQRP